MQGQIMKNFDIIQNSTGFDADWYAGEFPDAAAMDLPAQTHFQAIGHRLGRGVSPTLPRLQDDPALQQALLRRPRISYCTPIMNRPGDIRATLADNLQANRPLQEQIEFVLVFMDDDTETQGWVRGTFADDLRSGYLRMIVEPPLDGWHFGVAKNRHRAYAVGDIYSSLDGDNFVTLSETEQLLEVADAQDDWFLFHHFTGSWGDGSSGRISMPMSVYQAVGYDTRFMPRQYDEMDALLTAMSTWPDLPLVRVRSDNHGFSGRRSSQFLQEAGLTPRIIELDPPERRVPMNPKGADYVQQDSSMEAMTSFNQGLCFARNAPTPELREKYLKLAIRGRHAVIDALPRDKVLGTVFRAGDHLPPAELPIGQDQVCLFTCMKNDDGYLQAFYDHYKALGVSQFFVIDDGSDIPIRNSLPQADVHVFHPKVGSFVTAKGLWIEALIKAYLPAGRWALTVDADEFMDLPLGFDTLPDLTARLETSGQDIQPALLIDMVPGAPVPEGWDAFDDADFLRRFDHYVRRTDQDMTADYATARSIDWAFGPFKRLSWMLDTRYHAFGTMDALRKIPLFRTRHGRHVNQGFHTLHHTDGTSEPGPQIWDTDLILPIRHFKLVKLFSDAARAQMAAHVADSQASPYHARTTENIARIFGDSGADQTARILSLPIQPYADNFLRTLSPGEYRDAGPER